MPFEVVLSVYLNILTSYLNILIRLNDIVAQKAKHRKQNVEPFGGKVRNIARWN